MRRLIASGFLLTAVTGCDGSLKATGRVYASAKADSSRIYIDEPFPNVDGFVRIDSAVVWVFQRPDEQTLDTTRHVLWSERTLSGHCGFFSTAQTASPFPFEALVRVSRAGFKDVARRFRHDSLGTHRMLVVLAPIERATFSPGSPIPPCP